MCVTSILYDRLAGPAGQQHVATSAGGEMRIGEPVAELLHASPCAFRASTTVRA